MSRISDAVGQGLDEKVSIAGDPLGMYHLNVTVTFPTIESLLDALGGAAPVSLAPATRRSPRARAAEQPVAAAALEVDPAADLRAILDREPEEVDPIAEAGAELDPVASRYEAEIELEAELATAAVLESAWAPPEPTIAAADPEAIACGAGPDPFGDGTFCELTAGHRGYHRAATTSWESA